MAQRVQPGEHESEEAAFARLDNDLQVRRWTNPWQTAPEPVAVEEGAPWWWYGDEDASQQFLAAQGVTL
jgi:hypothetical protein